MFEFFFCIKAVKNSGQEYHLLDFCCIKTEMCAYASLAEENS